MIRPIQILVFPFVLMFSGVVEAKGRADSRTAVSVGKGQVEAAASDGVVVWGRNPASLIVNSNGLRVVGFGHTHSNNNSSVGYGGGFIYGKNDLAAGAAVHLSTADNSKPRFLGDVSFGLGKSIVLGLGVSYHTQDTLDDDDDGVGANVGFIFLPGAKLRFGLGIYNLTSSTKGLGGGLAIDVAAPVTLVADMVTDENLDSKDLAVGLRVAGGNFAFSGSYHFNIDTDADGVSVGFGYTFSGGTQLRLGYDDINRYFALVSLAL